MPDKKNLEPRKYKKMISVKRAQEVVDSLNNESKKKLLQGVTIAKDFSNMTKEEISKARDKVGDLWDASDYDKERAKRYNEAIIKAKKK